MKHRENCDGKSCDVCSKPKGLTWQRPTMITITILFVVWAAFSLATVSLVWGRGNALIAARQTDFAAQAEAQGYPKNPEYRVPPLPLYARYFLLFRPSHRVFYYPVAVSLYKRHAPPPAPYRPLGKVRLNDGSTPKG